MKVGFGLVVGSLLALSAATAGAATRTWDGGDASANWSAPANWSANAVPVAGDDVVFDASSTKNAVLDLDTTIASLSLAGYTGRLSPAGATQTLAIAGSFVQQSGTFVAPAYLTVGGQFSRTGGTFMNGGGTVFLTSAAGQTHRFGGAVFAALNVSDGLVAYWPFDDTALPVRDLSAAGTDLSGTLSVTTAAPTSFPNPRALAFVDSIGLSAPAAPYPSLLKPAAWTVSLWFRPAATFFPPGAGSCGQSGADGPGAELFTAGEDYALRICRTTADGTNHVRFFFRTTAGIFDCLASNAFVANGSTWHHLAGTSNGVTRTVYLDGVATACNFPQPNAYGTAALRMARHFSGESYSYTGALDDVRIYNRALGAGEVERLRQGQHPSAPTARQGAGDPVTVTGDLTVASRVFDLGAHALDVGGVTRIFGGSIVRTPPPDAGAPDLPRDLAAPDSTAPPDLAGPDAGADSAADLPVAPDAAVPEDAAGDAEPGPADTAVDAAGDLTAPTSEVGGADHPGLEEDAGARLSRIDLDVGCACDLAGRSRGPSVTLPLLAVWLLARRRRR